MAAKFTPGPWSRVMTGWPRPDPVFIGLKSIHCERLGMQIGFINGGAEREEQAAANALLIAAAPELLAALRDVTTRLAWLNSDDEHIMAATDSARAVIAKATGEAS